nr:hypothetical protein [Xenorhabdus hominickii]
MTIISLAMLLLLSVVPENSILRRINQ